MALTLPPALSLGAAEVVKSWEIDTVPSGFPVRFSLLTANGRQYVAYYDADHRMMVAYRSLSSDAWEYQVLPTKIGWDSHNYVTMATDRRGHLHLAGNMHGVPLIYFRTAKPAAPTTFVRLPMTGEREDRVTYPKFLTDHEGALIFNYRDGGSGRGARLFNKYDPDKQQWRRLLAAPLLDGEGRRNAYPKGPRPGPDGRFHLVWVWRHTPDCATNHDLSYARSRDLRRWESAAGEPVELPIRWPSEALRIDPVPSGGGIINGCQNLFFDSADRPVVTYHKADADGNMQIYAARFDDGRWHLHQLTTWEKPVPFSGRGSMGFIGIRIGALQRVTEDLLAIGYRHRDYGHGTITINEASLTPVASDLPVPDPYPAALDRLQGDFPGLEIRRTEDLGESLPDGSRFMLQWETLDANHDRPRESALPPPSTLRLYQIR